MPYPGMFGTNHKRLPMSAPLPRDEEIEHQFYAEPLEAWRAWNVVVVDNHLMLQSITYKTFWPFLDEMVAECNKRSIIPTEESHEAPNGDHCCGIYSVKRPAQALEWKDYGFHLTPSHHPPRVYGRVKIWGRILPYEHGYLAEKAYPAFILVPHTIVEHEDMDPREVRRELERNYRVTSRLA